MTEDSNTSATGPYVPESRRAVNRWLRVEGVAIGVLATLFFARGGHSWWLFAVLFLGPDVSLLAYIGGPRLGALIYNVFHSYALPVLLLLGLLITGAPVVVPLIWSAHIGFDRALGYGLKYPTGFAHTHLGVIGRAKRPQG